MISTEVALSFISVAVLLALSPGPDNIFVITQSMMQGPFAGLLVTLGLCTGLLVHTTIVAIGVGAVVQRVPFALLCIKSVGALYLLFLAWSTMKQARGEWIGQRRIISVPRLYVRGIIMNLTNPKVFLFFLAFFPQFIHNKSGSVIFQMIMLGTLFIISALAVFSGFAILGGKFKQVFLRAGRTKRILHWMISAVYVFLAVRLFL